MAETLSFCGKTLRVNAQEVASFENLALSASLKTKTQSQDGVERVQCDALDAASVTLTVRLSRALGVDVYAEVSDWLRMVREKHSGNLVIGGRDLFGVAFLLTQANVSGVRYAANGEMSYAEVALTFRESVIARASSGGGSGGDSYSGGGGSSVSTKSQKSPTTSGTMNFFDRIVSTIKNASGNTSSSETPNSSQPVSNLGGVSGYSVNVTSSATSAATKRIKEVTSNAKKAFSVSVKKTGN